MALMARISRRFAATAAATLCSLAALGAPVQAQEDAAQADGRHADCGKFKREGTWRASRTEQRADGSEYKTPQMRLAAPIYPVDELRTGMSGTVLIDFTIEATGEPKELVVLQSPGPAFSNHATVSVLCSQYRPATLNGTPITSRVRLPFRFEIQP